MMTPTNSNLDPQSPEDRFAHVTPEEQPYDGGGWPGDGSGTDDLADLMAHGDDGCCDGPDDGYDDDRNPCDDGGDDGYADDGAPYDEYAEG